MAPPPKQVKPADQVVIGKMPQADLDRVGKATLPTGDEYIDSGSDREPNDPNAIFTNAQRARLIDSFQKLVIQAGSRFQEQIVVARVNELVKRPAELPFIVSLMLGAVYSWGGATVMSAISGLVGEGFKGIDESLTLMNAQWEASAGSANWKQKALIKLHSSLGGLQGTLPPSIQGLQRGMAGQVVAARTWERGLNAQGKLKYLDLLADQANQMYQRIWQGGMLGRSDAEMLVIWKSWDAMYHSPSAYLQAITHQMKLFETSNIETLGRDHLGTPNVNGEYQKQSGEHLDRSVVRLFFTSKRESRYAIADRPFYGDVQEQKHPEDIKYLYEKYKIRQFVAPELEMTAIAKHKSVWLGRDPDTITIDDSIRSGRGPIGVRNAYYIKIQGHRDDGSNWGAGQDVKTDWDDPGTWDYDNAHVKGARSDFGHYGNGMNGVPDKDPWYDTPAQPKKPTKFSHDVAGADKKPVPASSGSQYGDPNQGAPQPTVDGPKKDQSYGDPNQGAPQPIHDGALPVASNLDHVFPPKKAEPKADDVHTKQ